MKIRIDTLLQNQCVLSSDFRKAFDRVDRKYLIQILRKMNFALLLVDMLENLYGKANAIIVVGVFFFSEEISLGRGIRQGCPLSASTFIVALEPLLEILRRHQWFENPMKRRVIAYADNVHVFVYALFHESAFP